MHMYILLHCECQIASYHSTVIVEQYQLEKRTAFGLLIPLNTSDQHVPDLKM